MKGLAGHGGRGKGLTSTGGKSKPSGWRGGRGHSPGQVCEAPVQVHGGGTAAEHGQDALQVQQLQLLTVAAEQNQHRGTQNQGKVRGDVWETLGKMVGITEMSVGGRG